MPLQILGLVPNVMVGNALTVPLTATFCVVALVEATVILPLGVPLADASNLTKTVVFETVPLAGVRDTLVPYPLPEVVDTSYPVGAVTIKLDVKAVPLTVKLCGMLASPEHTLNAVMVPVTVIVDEAATVTVKLLLELTHPVVLFLTVALKL